MGRIAPTQDSVVASGINADRFRDLNTNETARILLMEFGVAEPGKPFGSWAEWVHDLRADELREGDRVLREKTWLGTYICHGREDVLASDGADPDECPMCRYADAAKTFRPRRYHATNIIRYATKPGKHELFEPWNVRCQVWRFAENRFAEIVAMHAEYGDLRRRDVLVTCTDKGFQKYTMLVGADAAWLRPANNGGTKDAPLPLKHGMKLMDLVAQVYREGKLDDAQLSRVVGEKGAKDEVTERSRKLAVLLGIEPPATVTVSVEEATTSSVPLPEGDSMSQDELAGILGTQTAAVDPEAPAPDEAPPVVSEEEIPTTSLDDILSTPSAG